MKRKWMLATGSLLLCLFLSGCGPNVETVGGGPWPRYKEPDPITWTDVELNQLDQIKTYAPDVLKKVQAQDHSWRAIVQEHNKQALKHNQHMLEVLNLKPEDVQP